MSNKLALTDLGLPVRAWLVRNARKTIPALSVRYEIFTQVFCITRANTAALIGGTLVPAARIAPHVIVEYIATIAAVVVILHLASFRESFWSFKACSHGRRATCTLATGAHLHSRDQRGCQKRFSACLEVVTRSGMSRRAIPVEFPWYPAAMIEDTGIKVSHRPTFLPDPAELSENILLCGLLVRVIEAEIPTAPNVDQTVVNLVGRA
mmetsp:Transcript_55136/g.98411  ORF Transcript_55136/g.98411 Transcript_55136/m.98411 type:complete len:208 (-) Transcript_55136:210-833(-)